MSVLCFEVIMVDAFEDSVRFSLHLVGWLAILLSVCYNGQLMIDEVLYIMLLIDIDWRLLFCRALKWLIICIPSIGSIFQ